MAPNGGVGKHIRPGDAVHVHHRYEETDHRGVLGPLLGRTGHSVGGCFFAVFFFFFCHYAGY